jgi:high affinity Mn2+ porin
VPRPSASTSSHAVFGEEQNRPEKTVKKLVLSFLALAASCAFAQDQERWNAHFQSTYVWQTKPAFRSPYEGPGSLTGAHERSYSFTATAAFGLRIAPHTEVYLDPEAAQGVALSGLVGLSGFQNGELAKTSGRNMTVYRARSCLRHTNELGGEPVALASSANQLAGSTTSRRLVITAGTISALDIFDAGSVAHDPRTQFLNWSLMTHSAYDYAADARGYTSGLVVEYIDDGWAVRAAHLQVPRVPNQLQLDPRILRHYGDQLEFSRDYKVGAQSGTVRLLAFRTRALLARYDDALALAQATGSAPDINQVRTSAHSKWGMGIGVDHKVHDDFSVFARALVADGKTETDAFTEADRSLSAGLAMRGARWSRPDDTFGLAAGSGFLSRGHRQYLARGGVTFFLGDGALNYRPERVLEAYYSVPVARDTHLTLDAQRIVNPGYNADRGPVSVYGVRLHWER